MFGDLILSSGFQHYKLNQNSQIAGKDGLTNFIFLFTTFNKMVQEGVLTAIPIILINENDLTSQSVGFIFLSFLPFGKVKN